MKEKIFNAAKYLIFVATLLQLATSQVQIDVITKVFNPSVGFFLFLFSIFGMLMAFNAASYKESKRYLLFILGCVASTVTGFLYLRIVLADIQAATLLTFEDAQMALIFAIGTMIVYVLGTVTMLVTGNYDDI